MTTTTETVSQLNVDHIHESPHNPRRTFRDDTLQQLADNIRVEGVLQPLRVRPRTVPLFADDPQGTAGYECIFGHRRLRAAVLAGLTHVPAIVSAMTDAEVKRAQIAENLQREDVHPIEEAEGYQALITDHGETADRIAEQIGKSRSYVYGRLKLLQAVPEIRKACLEGTIGSEVALLISRLRSEKLQQDALRKIHGEAYRFDMKDGGQRSYRAIRDMLNERYALELKTAIFAIDDATLVPDAGDCGACTKRSGNAPEFRDIADAKKEPYSRQSLGPDVCTDPECFETKKKAHLKRVAEALEAKGKTVIGGAKARQIISAGGEVKNGYVEAGSVREAMKKAKGDVTVITAVNPRDGKTKQVVAIADLKAAGVKVAAPKPAASPGGWNGEAERQKREAQEKAQNAAAKTATAVHLELFDKVRAASAAAGRGIFEMRLLAVMAWEAVSWEDEEFIGKLHGIKAGQRGSDKTMRVVRERIDAMTPDELGTFLLDCLLIDKARIDGWAYARGERPVALLEAAQHYGIDVEAVRASVTGEPTKPAAKKAIGKPAKKDKPQAAAPAQASLPEAA